MSAAVVGGVVAVGIMVLVVMAASGSRNKSKNGSYKNDL